MTCLPVLLYPDSKLSTVSSPIVDYGADLHQLVDDMVETMYTHGGAGLAAIQIGVALNLFVMDCSDDNKPSRLLVFCNPVLTYYSGLVKDKEGCLSFPGVRLLVGRHASVKVVAQDPSGDTFSGNYTGLEARCIQHEYDHCRGVTMIDNVSNLERKFALSELKKNH